MRHAWLFLLAALAPTPASADLTASYAVPETRFTMRVEIASNGDLRCQDGGPTSYLIRRGGHDYFIRVRASKPIVMRAEDMAIVMAEQVAALDPHRRAEIDEMYRFDLLEKGTATVNGRTGSAWYPPRVEGYPAPAPWVVISHDPALAPLGKALMAQFDMSMMVMARAMGTTAFKRLEEVFRTGAPIAFTGFVLETVSFAPIPSSRFDLPAPPETLDGVRAEMNRPRTRPEAGGPSKPRD